MLNNYHEKLDEIKQEIEDIGNELLSSNRLLLQAIDGCNQDVFTNAKSHLKNISKKTNNIDNNIVKTLALHSPEARDLRAMVAYLKITNELLRASSNTRTFIKGFGDVCNEIDTKIIKEYAIPMQKFTIDALDFSLQMLNVECVDECGELYNNVLVSENKTDDLFALLEANVLQNAHEIEDFKKYHKIIRSLRKSEKIADRAMSIASLFLYAINGGEINH